ncbi:MAG TPA: ABC transporter permease [Chloroflexota bacterium]|nr:ABC transporter permease [Chloroflexota bacterium]
MLKTAPRESHAEKVVKLLALPPLARGGAAWRQAAGQSVRAALGALLVHKVRSAVTVFGIVLGVCGVLVIDAVGQAQNAAVAAQLTQLGSNLVTVTPGVVRQGRAAGSTRPSLTLHDAVLLQARASGALWPVAALTPEVTDRMPAIAGRLAATTTVVGARPAIQRIQNDAIARGAFFTAQDDSAEATVAVLGQTVVDKLFPGQDPVGRRLRLRNVDFRVVGVLAAKGHDAQTDLDDVVIVPLHTAQQRLLGYGNLASILLQADRTADIPAVIGGVSATLERAHHIAAGQPADFAVNDDEQVAQAARQQTALLSRVLSAVAGIALTIGGFGVMNIMLIAVTERTPEIGVRLAVGARPADVLTQFLEEAATLTIVGGAVGVACGYAAAGILTHAVPALAAHPAWPRMVAVAAALAVSLVTGLLFGLYPAYRAARLDPIVALRYE